MDFQTTKLELLTWLVNLQDPETLKELLIFRKKNEVDKYRAMLKPMTLEELYARADASERAIAAGDVFDLEDVEKEFETI